MRRNLKMGLFILIGITSVTFLSSCEVNRSLSPDKYDRIYMTLARESPVETSLVTGTELTRSYTFWATYGGPGKPTQNISVSFHASPALVDSFNARRATSYALFPEDGYKFENTSTTTIASGEKHSSSVTLTFTGNIDIDTGQYLLPITLEVNKDNVPVNESLKTTYFIINAKKAVPINSDIIITGIFANARGSDQKKPGEETNYSSTGVTVHHTGGYEYIQLMALRDINFSETPYSIVFANNGWANELGWAEGGTETYKINLDEGSVEKGTFFYVGSGSKVIASYWPTGKSTDISEANWIASRPVEAEPGDGFGEPTGSLLGNSASNPDGIAVFKGTEVTSTSVPVDVVFYGEKGQFGKVYMPEEPGPGWGFLIPEDSDLYNSVSDITGANQPYFGQGSNTFIVPEIGTESSTFAKMGGVITPDGNRWIETRDPTIITLTSSSSLSEIEEGEEATNLLEN